MNKSFFGIIPLVFVTFFQPLTALTVDTLTDELDVPAGATISLREAIRDTPSGGIIDFDPSLNGETLVLTIGELVISSKTLTVDASALSAGLTISGNKTSRALAISGSGFTVTLNHLNLTQGNSITNGGALHVSEADLVLTNCTLSNNHADQGGAIYALDSNLNLNQTRISYNAASDNGGGIFFGGAAVSLTLTDSTISNNKAIRNGGGIYGNSGSSLDITSSTIDHNRAEFGAGIFTDNSALTMVNSTCAHNIANTGGGGIYCGDDLALLSTTISANSATISGAGIFLRSNGTCSIAHSIVAANFANSGPDIDISLGTLTPSGRSLIGNNDKCSNDFPAGMPNANGDFVGDATTPIDPLLAPLARFGGSTDTMHPLVGSPVIDSGLAPILPSDQRGFPSVAGAASDIGSVEAGGVLTVTTALDENDPGLGFGAGDSLRECLASAVGNGDHVQFAAAFNGATIQLANGRIPLVAKTVFVDASSLASGITIDAGSASRVFTLTSPSNLAVHSVNMNNGSHSGVAQAQGGCVFNFGSHLTAINSAFSNSGVFGTNSSEGGALFTSGGSLDMIQCVLGANMANSASATNRGGAVYLTNRSSGDFTDCAFNANTLIPTLGGAANVTGAGICSLNSKLVITRCSFDGNLATTTNDGYGGAVYATGSTRLDRCEFFGNQMLSASGGGPARGGAVFNGTPGTLIAVNCNFYDNNSQDDAGAIGSSGALELYHCTLSANTATSDGGAVQLDNGSALFENTIIAGNGAGGGDDIVRRGLSIVTASGENLIGDNSTVAGTFPAGPLVGTSASPLDPLLGAFDYYGGSTRTMPPRSGSLAIDAALQTSWTPAIDQRDLARQVGIAPDLGAHENGHLINYKTWAQEMILSGLDIAFDGNAEGDNNRNGAEYATGLDPSQSDSGSILNIVIMPKIGGGEEAHITFSYEPDAPDLQYTLQRNTDLDTFFARYRYISSTETEEFHPSGNVTSTIDPANKEITVIDSNLTAGGGQKFFWRLRVELLP